MKTRIFIYATPAVKGLIHLAPERTGITRDSPPPHNLTEQNGLVCYIETLYVCQLLTGNNQSLPFG